MGLGWSLIVLFLAIVLPPLISVIFLLFRLSSRLGYSRATLKTPAITIAAVTVLSVLNFVANLQLFGQYSLLWDSGLLITGVVVAWAVDSKRLRQSVKKVKKIDNAAIMILARLFLVVILVPTAFFTVIILWILVTNPILDKIDHDKFTNLDTSMQGIYQKLKLASNVGDEWKYKAVCREDNADWSGPSVYNCVALVVIEKKVTSIKEADDLREKYFPIISNSQILEQNNKPDLGRLYDIGGNLVLSSTEMNYIETKSDIECRYLTKNEQSTESANLSPNNYSSQVKGVVDKVTLVLRCDGQARQQWYDWVSSTSTLIPN